MPAYTLAATREANRTVEQSLRMDPASLFAGGLTARAFRDLSDAYLDRAIGSRPSRIRSWLRANGGATRGCRDGAAHGASRVARSRARDRTTPQRKGRLRSRRRPPVPRGSRALGAGGLSDLRSSSFSSVVDPVMPHFPPKRSLTHRLRRLSAPDEFTLRRRIRST